MAKERGRQFVGSKVQFHMSRLEIGLEDGEMPAKGTQDKE